MPNLSPSAFPVSRKHSRAQEDHMAKRNHGGIITDAIAPGEFYISECPGGWGDRVTGIFIPGPSIKMAPNNSGEMLGIYEMPDPIQLPHLKRAIDLNQKDSRKVGETTAVPFDRSDEFPLHDALNLALSTGNIRHVPQDEMEDRWPEVWANRRSNIVFDGINKDTKGVKELISEHFDNWEANKKQKAIRKQQAARRAIIAEQANSAIASSEDLDEESEEEPQVPKTRKPRAAKLPPPPPAT